MAKFELVSVSSISSFFVVESSKRSQQIHLRLALYLHVDVFQL